jgi:hypothetical protein
MRRRNIRSDNICTWVYVKREELLNSYISSHNFCDILKNEIGTITDSKDMDGIQVDRQGLLFATHNIHHANWIKKTLDLGKKSAYAVNRRIYKWIYALLVVLGQKREHLLKRKPNTMNKNLTTIRSHPKGSKQAYESQTSPLKPTDSNSLTSDPPASTPEPPTYHPETSS